MISYGVLSQQVLKGTEAESCGKDLLEQTFLDTAKRIDLVVNGKYVVFTEHLLAPVDLFCFIEQSVIVVEISWVKIADVS